MFYIRYFSMPIKELKESLRETKDYLEQSNEAAEDGEPTTASWYGGKAFGNAFGALGGLGIGGYAGFAAAEPVYQAAEAAAPADVGPVVRFLGYSAPMAEVAVTAIFTYEGGQIGLRSGKYLGQYSGGGACAGYDAVNTGIETSFGRIRSFLEDDSD